MKWDQEQELQAWRKFGKTYGLVPGKFFEDGPYFIFQTDTSPITLPKDLEGII